MTVSVNDIDDAAKTLLKAMDDEKTSLVDKLKVFDTVVEWVKTRKEIAPAKREETGFERARRKLHGTPRSSPDPAGAEEADADAA